MNKAGYPYDNAPMERYFNTLKNELINLHNYHTEKELYIAIEEFAYTQYNHVRPHLTIIIERPLRHAMGLDCLIAAN